MSDRADHLREGSRVIARGWAYSSAIDDNVTVPPGTKGTVTGFGPGQIHVEWDNGARLSLIVSGVKEADRWDLSMDDPDVLADAARMNILSAVDGG